MAGLVVVLFALMGTIGVGYLLNGNTTTATVTDYEYVTDVTGLYNYTPVQAYAAYSPAQNNYQYSTTVEDLGTYTSGISYTEAGAANLNPIITPDTGSVTTTGTIAYADLPGTETTAAVLLSKNTVEGESFVSYRMTGLTAKIIPLESVVNLIGDATSITINMPNLEASIEYSSQTITYYIQPLGLYVDSTGTYEAKLTDAITNRVNAAGPLNGSTDLTRLWLSTNTNFTASWQTGTYTNIGTSIPVGTISALTVNANGTTTYTYTYEGNVSSVNLQTSSVNLILCTNTPLGGDDPIDYAAAYTPEITYSKTTYVDIDYLDPNYGVTTTAGAVYWNNGSDLGSVTWLFKKPVTTTSQTFYSYSGSGTLHHNWNLTYGGVSWQLTYNNTTYNLGSGWQGIQITDYYTGELQWTPVKTFTNFTEYTLGNSTTIASAVNTNSSISYYAITGSTHFNLAVVGTSVASGYVPGAMFNASFNVTNYFPQYAEVRVNFDSIAYVGSAVTVGSWTMAVDSATLIGTFTAADGTTYRADLTKPWSISWLTNSVTVSFTPYGKLGTNEVTVLSTATAKTFALSGQWVLDTDLYNAYTHSVPAYNWNFGSWGLSASAFLVCCMGLTALLAILFRISGVPFSGLDFAVILLANVFMWVIL